jgi:hypothetical protein
VVKVTEVQALVFYDEISSMKQQAISCRPPKMEVTIILLIQKFKIFTEGNDAFDFYSRSPEFESKF